MGEIGRVLGRKGKGFWRKASRARKRVARTERKESRKTSINDPIF